jgi:membrane associated rhomboid family serine protease
MKYLYILTFIIVYVSFGLELGYTDSSLWYTHFTYMFQHAGIVHLLLNSIAFISLFTALEKQVNKWLLSACIIAISFLASFAAMHDMPTVGASGMVYAMIGMFFGMVTRGAERKAGQTYKGGA